MAIETSGTSMSSSLTVVEIEGKGRGMVTSEPLKGGQIILQESPILIFSAFPLNRRHQQQEAAYCSHCFRCLVSEGFTCPSCSHPYDTVFCSSKCQSLALNKTHTPWVCEALRQLRHCSLLMENQPQERQMQASYLVATYNLSMTSPLAFKTLLSLHGDGRKPELVKSAMYLNSVISRTLSFPKGFSAFSVEMTAALLDKESRNSFSLMEPYSEGGERSVRAYGLYKNASMFNHDCLPNACRFDYLDSTSVASNDHDSNTDIYIRMIHDVPQGTEICLSYFRVSLSYRERKRRLLDYFGFACFCGRCKVESNEVSKHGSDGVCDSVCACFFGRYLCEKVNCGGTLAPLPPSNGNLSNVMECNFCGNLKNNNHL